MSININSLMDMQDLIGLRVVTVFEKDLSLVENVIENSFKIMRRYKPNYLAVDSDTFAKHFIIKFQLRMSVITWMINHLFFWLRYKL